MKRVLILGATSGIAKALAYKMASKKYNLILAGRDTRELEVMSGDITIRYGVDVIVQNFSALETESHTGFIEKCINHYGGFDIVFLAYGYLGNQKDSEIKFHEAEKIININYTSYVSILSIVANYFEKEKKGKIVALSSVAGDRGRQSNYTYGSAKGALSIYLQGLRNRLNKSNVRVITIKPGFVDTKMTYGLINDSLLTVTPEDASEKIFNYIEGTRDIGYVPGFWRYIMLIIKIIPERYFKKLKL